VDALAATRPIPRAVSPSRTEPDNSSADPTVRKPTVVMCHVTWIIALVMLGPPKRVDGSVPGDSFLTTRTSPPTPWTAAARTAREPAAISGAFTPRSPVSVLRPASAMPGYTIRCRNGAIAAM
jgi:hypothetical protein